MQIGQLFAINEFLSRKQDLMIGVVVYNSLSVIDASTVTTHRGCWNGDSIQKVAGTVTTPTRGGKDTPLLLVMLHKKLFKPAFIKIEIKKCRVNGCFVGKKDS
jgi:hypothetical protein